MTGNYTGAERRMMKLRVNSARSHAGWVNDVRPHIEPAGETFRLVNEVEYAYGGNSWVICPMKTDFASVPRLAVWLIPRFGKFTEAAIVHDWFCEYGIRLGEVTAREADVVFREIMRLSRVTFLMRWLMWTGVRWGAALNPVRQTRWWRDLPAMLPFTILALPMLLPAAIGIIWGLLLFALVQFPTSLFLRDEATTAGVDATT